MVELQGNFAAGSMRQSYESFQAGDKAIFIDAKLIVYCRAAGVDGTNFGNDQAGPPPGHPF
jgi:hypothetical protein